MKTFFQFVSLMFLSVLFLSLAALAQTPPPVVAQPGISGFIAGHGGLVATVTLCVFAAMSMLSAFRLVLLRFDGVNQGDNIPAEDKVLTFVNKACLVGGKILDFLQGNIQH